jgi:hypothetical protein
MLSFMAMDFFAKSPVLTMPLLALGLFITAFLTVVMRTALADKRYIDSMSNLPLDDGNRKGDTQEKQP